MCSDVLLEAEMYTGFVGYKNFLWEQTKVTELQDIGY
jgi:hypothetical protein